MDYPTNRTDAKRTGAKYYFTGKPCSRGHVAPRRTKGSCTECDREDWAKDNARRALSPKSESSKAAGKRYYEKNREVVIARANMRPREEKRRNQKNWYIKNPEQCRAQVSLRKRRHRNATPPWLSNEQKNQIKQLYLAAQRLTRETGVRYVVDHNIPLISDEVCGLHVPWNLSIMTQEENLAKSNKILDMYV